MSLKIYNTLTQKKEIFQPLEKNKVRMYVCGPTVYGLLHIGNFRGAIFFNLVRNYFEHLNYEVTYVYNYTDIDDKIIHKAKQESLSTQEVAQKYIHEFEKDYKALGLRPHTHNPKATDHISDMIAMIQTLIDSGHAYVTESGEVFYSIKTFKKYGQLSGKDIADLQAGARIEINDQKKYPLDFTLWKPSKEGEPAWDAPWCKGRPGWHIECSVMNWKLIGESIDIHGGGVDLIFPHHENETAQSEGAFNKRFAQYWMHHHLIQFGSEKMSKSLGNIITTRSFLKEHHPEILKYMMLMSHYRSVSVFSEDQVQHAIFGLMRIYSALSLASQIQKTTSEPQPLPKDFKELLQTTEEKITLALNDDFNTPQMFACIFDVVRAFNEICQNKPQVTLSKVADAFKNFIKKQGYLLALFQEDTDVFIQQIEDILLAKRHLKREEINQLVKERNEARLKKDYKKSDQIRNILLEKNIEIRDVKNQQGVKTLWTIKQYK